jgi:predicted thioesterase
MITPGMSASVAFTVDASSTALALGSGDVEVLGTPKVVALMEGASVAAVAPGLEPPQTTVGTHLTVDHLAPTHIGHEVIASARVVDVVGRRVRLEVTVTEGGSDVARGTHERVVVDRERFLAT